MSQLRRSTSALMMSALMTSALIAILALGLGGSSEAFAQAASQQRPGARSAATAAQRRAAQQRTANRNMNGRNPLRSSSGPRPAVGQSNLEAPKTTAETRAEFQKLIGANWIWSPAYEKDAVPQGDVYFRKTIMAGGEVEFAQIHAACDNQYELFVNGQPAGNGADWRKMDVHDVTKLMRPGVNVVAVKATNADAGPAGIVIRVIVKERGGTYENFSTDETWRTSVKEFAELESARVPRSHLARGESLRPARRRAALGRRGRDLERRLAVHDRSGVHHRANGHRRAGRLADRHGLQREGEYPRVAGRRAAALDQRRRPRWHVRDGATVLRQAQERAGHSFARRVCHGGRRRPGWRRPVSPHGSR